MRNLSGIRIHGPGNRAAEEEDLRLRPHGQRDRPNYYWDDKIENTGVDAARKCVREVLT